MTRPASYKLKSINFRTRWTRMKSLGENINPNMRNWLFNHVSTRVLSSRIETPWVLGRGSWRLLGVLENSSFSFLGLLLHPWRFYLFWVREDDGLQSWRQRCQWEAQLDHEAIVKNLGRRIASTLWFQFLLYSSIL